MMVRRSTDPIYCPLASLRWMVMMMILKMMLMMMMMLLMIRRSAMRCWKVRCGKVEARIVGLKAALRCAMRSIPIS